MVKVFLGVPLVGAPPIDKKSNKDIFFHEKKSNFGKKKIGRKINIIFFEKSDLKKNAGNINILFDQIPDFFVKNLKAKLGLPKFCGV